MQKNKKIFVCAAWENDARIGTLFCENFLSINIDMDDGYRSFDKLIETSVFYRITKDEANLLVKNIAKTVAASWKYLASKYGINEPGQRRMASAFQLSENEGMR